VEAATKALSNVAKFRSGVQSDFNSEKNKPYPYVWLESLSRSETVPNGKKLEEWNVNIRIAYIDKMDSKPEAYEKLKDQADDIASKLCDIMDRGLHKSNLVTMPTRQINPFHKQHADCLTGVDLTFALVTPAGSVFCVDLAPKC
jgi:hypothetical protein